MTKQKSCICSSSVGRPVGDTVRLLTAWETHAACSRVQSSRGCTCTPHRRHCTGLRCDSYTSSDNQGPSAQMYRLQTPETQSNSGCSTHAYVQHMTRMVRRKCLNARHAYTHLFSLSSLCNRNTHQFPMSWHLKAVLMISSLRCWE